MDVPRWVVVCPECRDDLYQFMSEDLADAAADRHADNRQHSPYVEERTGAR